VETCGRVGHNWELEAYRILGYASMLRRRSGFTVKISDAMIRRHDHLVERLHDRSRSIHSRYAAHIQCRQGCAQCCHGLFDISIFDALRVAKGFASLPAEAKDAIAERASAIQNMLLKLQPDLPAPFFLDELAPERIDEIVDIVGNVRCPFLAASDSCLIYEFRPVTCLLEGIPMVDARDGLFSDWCEMNFRKGVSEDMLHNLRLDYYEIRAVEQDAVVFIPSVIYAIINGKWSLSPDR
jgi:Fe-S-cluster containining protein